MTPARFATLCALLNLGDTRIAGMTGYSRDAVKNWRRGHCQVWPPFAEWLERVAPEVRQVLSRHPAPNRNRPEVPPSAEAVIAEALRSLPPPLVEPREVRQAAIAAERAARMAPLPEGPWQGVPVRATPVPAGPIVVPRQPEAPAGPPAMCGRCGRFYRTPTCEACEGAG